jgi:putative phosphoribosyl transferase
VPVAFEVAAALDAPLDVIVVRKLGVPLQPELGMGAIGEGGVRVIDRDVMAHAGVSDSQLQSVERQKRSVLEARVAQLRCGRERTPLDGRAAVIVDDGVATGSTARVACEVARRLGAERVLLAAPVAPAHLSPEQTRADEVVCVSTPEPFVAVGHHYRDFSATSDEKVMARLDAAAQRRQH